MAPRNTICRRCTLRDTSSSRWHEEMSKLTKCRSSLINHLSFLYICRVLNYVSTFFIDHSEYCDLQKVSDHKLGKIWALWLALSPFLGIIWSPRLITTGKVCLFWNWVRFVPYTYHNSVFGLNVTWKVGTLYCHFDF